MVLSFSSILLRVSLEFLDYLLFIISIGREKINIQNIKRLWKMKVFISS